VPRMVAQRFEKTADAMDAQLDLVEQRLLLMRQPKKANGQKQTTKVDLCWEGISQVGDNAVEFDVPKVTVVGAAKMRQGRLLNELRLAFKLWRLNSAHTTLIARRSGPASAYSPQAALKVQVSGAVYKQFDARSGARHPDGTNIETLFKRLHKLGPGDAGDAGDATPGNCLSGRASGLV
jgi:hypothetical protein